MNKIKQILSELNMPNDLPEGLVLVSDNAKGIHDKVYYMDIYKDEFIHFTKKDRIPEIIKSKKLLLDSPYPQRGAYAVYAISTKYGEFYPSVQTTGISKDTSKLGAILFTTNEKPKDGITSEVTWNNDVILKTVKELSYEEAVKKLYKKEQGTLQGDFPVVYYNKEIY